MIIVEDNFYDNPVTPFMAEVLLNTPYTIIELYTLKKLIRFAGLESYLSTLSQCSPI